MECHVGVKFWRGKKSDFELCVAHHFFITNPHMAAIIRILISRIPRHCIIHRVES